MPTLWLSSRVTPRCCFPPRAKKASKRLGWCVMGYASRQCSGCGQTFYPRTGTQRFCRFDCPGRARKRGFNSFRPAGEVRSCGYCGHGFVPTVSNQRFCSPAHARMGRLPIEKALYNRDHKALRARLKPQVATGTVICSWPGCGLPILPGQAWDLGHMAGRPGVYAGPQHASCNRKTRGVLTSPEPVARIHSRAW